MTTIKTFADGGRVVEVLGVRVTVGRRGDVVALSDWGRAAELESAGVLRRAVLGFVAWVNSACKACRVGR